MIMGVVAIVVVALIEVVVAISLQIHTLLQPAASLDAQESNLTPTDNSQIFLHSLRFLTWGGHTAVVEEAMVVVVMDVVRALVVPAVQMQTFLQPVSSLLVHDSTSVLEARHFLLQA